MLILLSFPLFENSIRFTYFFTYTINIVNRVFFWGGGVQMYFTLCYRCLKWSISSRNVDLSIALFFSYFLNNDFNILVISFLTAIRAYDSKAEGWVFESGPQQTSIVKTCSNSSAAKHSAIFVSVMRLRRQPLETLERAILNGHKCRA